MSMKLINIKSGRACAFCRYWYDMTNSAIVPVNPGAGFWKYDTERKELCMQMEGIKKNSWASCSKYECKLS